MEYQASPTVSVRVFKGQRVSYRVRACVCLWELFFAELEQWLKVPGLLLT